MMVQVLRIFPAGDRQVAVGDILDASDWPVNRVRQLTKLRLVQPVAGPPQEIRRGPGRPRKDEARP